MAIFWHRKPRALRFPKAGMLGAVWLTVNLVGIVSSGAAPTPTVRAIDAPTDPFTEAKFSLSMRRAPLHRMLSLLETTSGLHFRYGAVPDVVVDTTFNNAPLLPTLENLLRSEGFQMQRNGREVFVFSAPHPLASTHPLRTPTATKTKLKVQTEVAWLILPLKGPQPNLNAPAAWYYWTRATPPSPDWMLGQNAPKSASESELGAWQLATLMPDATRRAGIAVAKAAPALKKSIKQPDDERLWLRWPITLRQVPSNTQLLLETPAEATLYVNGAPLLRRWQGTRLIDLSHVLHPGLNCLALYWPHTAPSSGDPFLLHYEWFFSASSAPALPMGATTGSDEATGELTSSGSSLATGSSKTPTAPTPH